MGQDVRGRVANRSGAIRIAKLALGAMVVAWLLSRPTGVHAGLGIFVLIGGLWLTQALPLPVTALMVPLLASLTGLQTPRGALSSFAHPVIFLFLGGFALAAALRHQGLDRALADRVLALAQGRRLHATLLLGAMTAAISMWISNIAALSLALPLAMGLLRSDDGSPAPGPGEKAFVLLVAAYSASIGGIGTLIGCAPNAIAAAQAGIGFAQWLTVGLPLMLLFWVFMAVTLMLVLRPSMPGRSDIPKTQQPWTRQQWVTIVIAVLTLAGWTLGRTLAGQVGIRTDFETVVALTSIFALFASGALEWRAFEREVEWGVLLLFGGGLALSELMSVSGASHFLGESVLALMQGAPLFVKVMAIATFAALLTELVSNTACTAVLIPIFVPVAAAIGMSSAGVAMLIAMTSSLSFMLPVATPPNAMVFATGDVSQALMVRCGLWVKLGCLIVIGTAAATGWWL